jgi:hypothetical protein
MKKTLMLWIFGSILILLNIIVYLTKWGGDVFIKYFSDSLPAVCALVSSVCLLYASRAFGKGDFAKIAWLLLFIGITADFFAETIYGILEIGFKMDMNETYPSLADYFWCGAYIFLFAGLAMMFIGYRNSGFPMGNLKIYGLIAAVCMVLFASVFYFLLIPILMDTNSGPLAKFISLFYPVVDILVVIPAIILIYITSLFGKSSLSVPWKLLAIGFVCFTFADIIYSYLVTENLYGNGNMVDLAWHSGYLLIGLAGLYQRELIESMKGGAAI